MLERGHKSTQAASSLHDLVQARVDLLEELDKKTKRNYILTQKIFYEYENKSGKFLARALRSKNVSMTAHSLTDSAGRKIVFNNEIEGQFVQYYTSLYNLFHLAPQREDSTRTQMIRDFLTKYSLKPLSNSDAKALDRPLSSEEFDTVLKQLKARKSPWPRQSDNRIL